MIRTSMLSVILVLEHGQAGFELLCSQKCNLLYFKEDGEPYRNRSQLKRTFFLSLVDFNFADVVQGMVAVVMSL